MGLGGGACLARGEAISNVRRMEHSVCAEALQREQQCIQ